MDPRRLLPLLAGVTLLAVLGTTALVALRPDSPSAGGSAASTAGPGVDGARAVLADWDERRARAWAAGDVPGLRSLYAEGSRTGRADARMLASYVDRGLTVHGLRTQVLALDVIEVSADTVEVRVTDRVAGAQAVDGDTVLPLPVDRPSTRRIVLTRIDGVWLVDEVRGEGTGCGAVVRDSCPRD